MHPEPAPRPTGPATRWLALALRVLLAAFFLVSAVAKIMAIDDFELYIFSYGFLSLNVSFLAARLCIAVELLLALFIAVGWWRRWVDLAALLTVVFFTLFLGYAALIGRTDSCQCMGRLADMPPVWSMVKNAVLIVLILLYDKCCAGSAAARPRRWQVLLAPLAAVAVVVAVFCISVPDNWMFGPEESRFDRALLQQSVGPDGALAEAGLDRGHQVVAFVTRGCPYCRMTREKLASISRRNHLDTTRIHYYEPADLPDNLFLRITYGQRPFVVLLDEGVPTVTYHYRNISERQLSRFLKQ